MKCKSFVMVVVLLGISTAVTATQWPYDGRDAERIEQILAQPQVQLVLKATSDTTDKEDTVPATTGDAASVAMDEGNAESETQSLETSALAKSSPEASDAGQVVDSAAPKSPMATPTDQTVALKNKRDGIAAAQGARFEHPFAGKPVVIGGGTGGQRNGEITLEDLPRLVGKTVRLYTLGSGQYAMYEAQILSVSETEVEVEFYMSGGISRVSLKRDKIVEVEPLGS